MLNRHKSLIARVLAEGTGAAITVKPFVAGGRQGLKMWFDDLDEKHGPIAELKPYGLLTHRVKLTFGLFSSRVIAQIAAAQVEELVVARALVRSVATVSELTISGQALDSWSVTDGSFEVIADYRHQNLVPDSDEAVVITCSEIIVPLMAAMAELIGYDQVENPADSNIPEVEGGLSQATVSRRERNPRSRLLCLRIHGNICKACGLDPARVYGEAGGIIEVHHLEPVSMLEKPRPYDPEIDLVPLCPSCHRAVHTRRPWPLSPSELSSILESLRA
ncbi:HNH endonuclease [Pseudomonas sp. AN3A02]|jgi:5-methylcytosine-specific restriction protein A|uniref:HNH endonuclease n=1 Tax=Pseudomonas sp. AN3A02 TaxID=2719587 RepID=UPI00142FBB77|nr:HNH endonuclease [Pseudomonas sp. AN3A02]NIL17283.1 HNH endonuclease [Pseudomonas sp. AN3A02]